LLKKKKNPFLYLEHELINGIKENNINNIKNHTMRSQLSD
jgi:hypothetical protein